MAEENTQAFEQEQATVAEVKTDSVSARNVEMHRTVADVVQAAQSVTIRQGGAREIRAQDVTIRQGAAVSIDADSVSIVQGAAGLVRSSDAQLGAGSTTVAVLADTVKLDQAGAQFILGRDTVEMDQSAAGILVAHNITARDSAAVLMFADKVEGDVTVVMDRQMAISFGAAMGAALGLVLAVFGILRRRK